MKYIYSKIYNIKEPLLQDTVNSKKVAGFLTVKRLLPKGKNSLRTVRHWACITRELTV